MKKTVSAGALALAFPLAGTAQEAVEAAPPIKTLGVVTVTGPRPTSLPTQLPTTMESATREQIERTVNATDSEDALKYFPSLLVRKRYVGDYNHAILSTRASGTGNSARSAVYADGILLSNFLGNGVGGLSYVPRWGLVTPEEIDRVDVMYGPFSAAYAGNSVGAVVDYVTRMPSRFEAHAKVGYVVQPFDLYHTHETYKAWQASASIGSRAGDWSWWLDANRTDSDGQPLTFATRLVSSGSGSGGVPVTGAVPGKNNAEQPWYLLGAATQYRTRQDHLKAKVAWDITPTLRASYVFGAWRNQADGNSQTYLHDAAGNAVYSGPINIDGVQYANVTGADFAVTRESLLHTMHGLSLKTHSGGEWDWEAAASLYDYGRDDKRQNAAVNTQPDALDGGAGTIAKGAGTGWNTLSARATWRPPSAAGAHVVEAGVQQDRYELRYRTTTLAGDWRHDDDGSLASNAEGKTSLRSLWAQDAWQLHPRWKTVLGLRYEHWHAHDGRTDFSATSATDWPSRTVDAFSPKAAISFQALPDTVVKASVGRAWRMPTVAELYGATSTANSQFINDPNLAPEKSWTGELSIERDFGIGVARLTGFAESTRDALYTQSTFDPVANKNISRVQNVGHIGTTGVEAAFSTLGWPWSAVDLQGSVTYADSKIKENDGFVVTPGDTIGKWQPNIPRWRAVALGTWRIDERLAWTVGARYSGKQYRTLNNSDTFGFTYQGVSKYFTVDTRLLWKVTRQWSAAFGIDNLNSYKYWNFHPYPQRSYSAELKWDL